MNSKEIEILKEKLKSAILDSGEGFLKMKKRLGQKVVAQIDGKIVTRSADYFLKKMKEKKSLNP